MTFSGIARMGISFCSFFVFFCVTVHIVLISAYLINGMLVAQPVGHWVEKQKVLKLSPKCGHIFNKIWYQGAMPECP